LLTTLVILITNYF